MAAQTPHRCPVCGGRGFVPNGWYSTTSDTWGTTSTTPEQCRSCVGTGVLWAGPPAAERDENGFVWAECEGCEHPIFRSYRWDHQGGTPPQEHEAEPRA